DALEKALVGIERLVALTGQLVRVRQRIGHIRVVSRQRRGAAEQAHRAAKIVPLLGFERSLAQPVPGTRFCAARPLEKRGQEENQRGSCRAKPPKWAHRHATTGRCPVKMDFFNHITNLLLQKIWTCYDCFGPLTDCMRRPSTQT